MQAIREQRKRRNQIEPWTTATTREGPQQKYDLDETRDHAYMQLDNLREELFYMAKELLRLQLQPVKEGSAARVSPRRESLGRSRDDKGGLVGLWYFRSDIARKGQSAPARG